MADDDKKKLQNKLDKIWKDRKYELLDVIRKATPVNESDKKKNGLSVFELSDKLDLTPGETQQFLRQIVDWGANIWVNKNQVLAHKELAITRETYSGSDLGISLENFDVFSEDKEGFRFGLICDTHFGSHRSSIGMLRAAYRFYESEGIKHVIMAGNILAGKPHPKYGFDLIDKTLEGQLKRFKKYYPEKKGITTHFILGHADRTFEKDAVDPSSEIKEIRPDFNYLGLAQADVILHPSGRKPVRVRVFNEKQMYRYGISYEPQKKLDNIAPGNKPDIWLIGGAQKLWNCRYQNVEVAQLPGLQYQTQRMMDRAYRCNVGFSVAEIVPSQKGAKLYVTNLCDLGSAPSVSGGLRE